MSSSPRTVRVTAWRQVRVALCVVLTVAACSSSNDAGKFHGGSSEDAGHVDFDAAEAGFECPSSVSCGRWTQFGQACDACMTAHCCGCTGACTAQADCGAYLDCIASCDVGDQPCESQCETAYPSGISEANTLLTCSADQCNDACYVAKSKCGGWDEFSNVCYSDCLATNCCAQGAACARGSECSKLYGCMSQCNADLTCGQACYDQYPAEIGTYEAFVDCANACPCS